MPCCSLKARSSCWIRYGWISTWFTAGTTSVRRAPAADGPARSSRRRWRGPCPRSRSSPSRARCPGSPRPWGGGQWMRKRSRYPMSRVARVCLKAVRASSGSWYPLLSFAGDEEVLARQAGLPNGRAHAGLVSVHLRRIQVSIADLDGGARGVERLVRGTLNMPKPSCGIVTPLLSDVRGPSGQHAAPQSTSHKRLSGSRSGAVDEPPPGGGSHRRCDPDADDDQPRKGMRPTQSWRGCRPAALLHDPLAHELAGQDRDTGDHEGQGEWTGQNDEDPAQGQEVAPMVRTTDLRIGLGTARQRSRQVWLTVARPPSRPAALRCRCAAAPSA